MAVLTSIRSSLGQKSHEIGSYFADFKHSIGICHADLSLRFSWHGDCELMWTGPSNRAEREVHYVLQAIPVRGRIAQGAALRCARQVD